MLPLFILRKEFIVAKSDEYIISTLTRKKKSPWQVKKEGGKNIIKILVRGRRRRAK